MPLLGKAIAVLYFLRDGYICYIFRVIFNSVFGYVIISVLQEQLLRTVESR